MVKMERKQSDEERGRKERRKMKKKKDEKSEKIGLAHNFIIISAR